MGLFDFPRIHFKGNIDLNVPTINNSYYFPLTLYDQTRSKAFLPPRLYFTSPDIPHNVQAKIQPTIFEDPDNGFCYIEIEPIHTIPLLRTWCHTPLGSNPTAPDNDYVPFYEAAEKDLGKDEGAVLIGNAPGYWNMYGGMGASMTEVEVTGIQTFDGTKVQTWTENDKHQSPAVTALLNAAFDMDTAPASGRSTSVIVETLSSQSIYANIFCSNVNLYDKEDKNLIFLKGKPGRFASLLYGTWRVVNWLPAMAGSARWCSCIPFEDLSMDEEGNFSKFIERFKQYDERPLKGIFVTFTTHEVFENRYDQNIYQSGKPIINPAQATTIGSITPWYEGDMKTEVIGRRLLSLNMDPYYVNTGTGEEIPIQMTPAIASLKKLSDNKAIFSLDLGNSWPEEMTPSFEIGKVQPAKRGEAKFETLDLGNLSLRYGTDPTTEFLSIPIDPINNPISKVAERGCIFDVVVADPNTISLIESNFIKAFINIDGKDTQVLNEAKYSLFTDEKGLYAEKGDNPANGYWVNDDKKIQCRLRIFQKGLPVTNPVKIWIAEYIVPEAANDPIGKDPTKVAIPNLVTQQFLSDNDVVQLKTGDFSIIDNAVYYFAYESQYPDIENLPFTDPNYTVQDTGCFCCLRVYPKKDFSKYLDPKHPEFTPPDFSVVYEEIFKLYDVVYPSMAEVHPFTKDVWDNGIMAGLAVQRTDPAKWNDILYMSRSRELNPSQRELLLAWAETFNNPSKNLGQDPILKSDDYIPSFTVRLEPLEVPKGMPLIQSGAWAVQGNKLLMIGGMVKGFHGLNQEQQAFGQQYANRKIWVICLDDLSFVGLDLDNFGEDWQPLCASNMQFCQEGDDLYIAGGYGAKSPLDSQSNMTFNTMFKISISAMIHQVEIQENPSKAVLVKTQSPFLKVAGGELFKNGETFILSFGQDFSGVYTPGKTGEYTNCITIFNLENSEVFLVKKCSDPSLHRRDLNVVPLVQNEGTIYAGLGGVFDQYGNGFQQPVYFDPSQPNCGIKLDPILQTTNQYNCAKAIIFDSQKNTCFTVLMGGIGQFQYHQESRTWENGDDGAKLPFVNTITQMIYSDGRMQQHIQLPPEEPVMPGLMGANAIFIADTSLLWTEGVIDYCKIVKNETVIGLMYGGIQSQLPTSSVLYPTFVNDTIYKVILEKKAFDISE